MHSIAMMFAMGLLIACATPPSLEAPPLADPPAADPAVDWLAQIEQKTAAVTSLRATLIYTREQGVLGDIQHRYGNLLYQADPQKFAVSFDRVAVDGALHPMDKRYVFDGRFIVERDGDEKIYSRRELAGPGEQADLFSLGNGPFALPLNLKKDAVLERFAVAWVDEGEDEPVHLVLTPLEGVKIEATQIDLWFDRESLLPVRVKSVDHESENVTDIRLNEVQINPDDMDVEAFDTAPPQEPGWQINETRLEDGTVQ